MSEIVEIKGVKYERLSTGIMRRIYIDVVAPGDEKAVYNRPLEVDSEASPQIVIFSYNRDKMLLKNLKYLSKFKVDATVIDDGSDYNSGEHSKLSTYLRIPHQGKEGFWRNWNMALQVVRLRRSEVNIFIADDFEKLDLKRVMSEIDDLPPVSVCNVIYDGRKSNWGNPIWEPYKDNWMESNFTDCGFFTRYEVLSKLNFEILPIINRPEGMSSGVGRQLSMRLREMQVPMYTPLKSYAFHGDHDSVMHPDEREKNKLISR